MKQSGELSVEDIDTVLAESKKAPKDDEDDGIIRFKEYFPAGYTVKQMDKIITDLLMEWKQRESSVETGESA
jgi:hypothetical protein